MNGYESYVDLSTAVVQSIDVEELSSQEIGASVGRGHEFAFHALGPVNLADEQLHCGVKLSLSAERRHTMSELRLISEIATIDLLLEHVPQLAGQVPRFMAALSVDGGQIRGLLTEDASRGGELDVTPLTENYRLAKEIAETIHRAPDIRLNIERARYSTSFSVDGEERLLDLTPALVEPTSSAQNSLFRAAARQAVQGRELVLDIPSDSKLGQSLAVTAL